jgi:hypothetical protein
LPEFDAILVPGGGLLDDGSLPPWVINRFERAIARAEDAPIIALSAGTTHKRRAFFEATAGAQWLLTQGYPANRILTETSSRDTIGNAYFARTIHTDPARFRKLLIITSAFHMPRTEAIFRWVFGLAHAEYELDFEAVPDTGLSHEALVARGAREHASLDAFRKTEAKLRTLSAVHNWLFTAHEAYATGLTPRKSRDPAVLASY